MDSMLVKVKMEILHSNVGWTITKWGSEKC